MSKIKEEKEEDSDDSYEGVIDDIQKNVDQLKNKPALEAMFKKDKHDKHLINTATTHFKSFQKVAKVAVDNQQNDQKAIDSP